MDSMSLARNLMRSRCSQFMTARITCSSPRKATWSAGIQRRLSLVAGFDSRQSAAVWRFFSFEGLRDFKPAFDECAIVFGIGLVLSHSCGLEATGSAAELRRCVARRGQRFEREHCGDKPASVGVLSWVPFLSVSLQRVLVFLFVAEANAWLQISRHTLIWTCGRFVAVALSLRWNREWVL